MWCYNGYCMPHWVQAPAPCVAAWQQPRQHVGHEGHQKNENIKPAKEKLKPKPKKEKLKPNYEKLKPKNEKLKPKKKEKFKPKKKPNKTKLTSIMNLSANTSEAVQQQFSASKARTLIVAAVFAVCVLVEPLSLVANGLRVDVARFLAHDAANHGKALALWPALILSAFPELSTLSLDLMLVSIVMMCLRNRADVSAQGLHDFVEYSAGSGMLTLQCLVVGLLGIGLDKVYSTEQDNTTSGGLRLWINEMTITKCKSLNWFGTQCSSFSALCANNSQRWAGNLYWGDETAKFVRDGNQQMVITALLMMVSFWCSNVPVLEQPMCSSMPLCPPLSTALEFMSATRVVTWNKAFGSASMKPLQIISSSNIIECLRRPKPKGRSVSLASRGADGFGFSGIKKRLIKSQAYTEMFGRCVADMAKAHMMAA